MIHFLVTFSRDADNSPFGRELRKLGIRFKIFSGVAQLPFQHRRALMFLLGYPKLIHFSIKKAVQSMFLSRPRPDAIVLGSDVEVWVCACARILLPWKRPKLVLLGFIYTARSSRIYSWLRKSYYFLTLSNCTRVICHSRFEIDRYADIFRGLGSRFAFVPFGGHVEGWEEMAIEELEARDGRPFRIFSAGRSGRDYRTLAVALGDEDFDLTIVCDDWEAVTGIPERENLRILRNCYGKEYLDQLRGCDVVVVPLAVDNISAGQMVLVQAMAYGKAIVVTRTPTVEDYVTDGQQGLMVRPGDAEEMRRAIRRLRDNNLMSLRLRKAARNAYEQRFSQKAYIRNLVDVIQNVGSTCAS